MKGIDFTFQVCIAIEDNYLADSEVRRRWTPALLFLVLQLILPN
jgi:hypothetical protein